MCVKKDREKTKQSLKKEICDIFSDCQRTTAVHQRNAIILKKVYENAKLEEFWGHLKDILSFILVNENNALSEKILNFFGIFCALLKTNPVQESENSDDSTEYCENPLLMSILFYALKASKSSQDIIRIRACQIINIILDNLVGVDISILLCENLERYLLQRLRDPKNVVRQQAIIALYRLQEPGNPEDEILSEFIRLMNSDTFPKVRQLCVEKVAVRSDVIAYMLIRIRDNDPKVRVAAYKRLSGFPKFLKISEKQQVLCSGFFDKCEEVNEFVKSTLIKSWLDFYDNNILKFMKSLRLDADEKDIKDTVEIFEKVLGVIFENTNRSTLTETLPLDNKHLVPFEELNWEVASFWRIYVQYLSRNTDFGEELENVVPELIYLCKYIKQFYVDMPREVTTVEFLEQQFIIKQLFLMTKCLDVGDVTTRECLNKLIVNILENVVLTRDVVQVIVSNLEITKPNPEVMTQFVSEIISEIRYPMDNEEAERNQKERDFKVSQLTVKIIEQKSKQEVAVENQNFIEAERLKQEISILSTELTELKNAQTEQERQAHHVEKKTDLFTIIKCLDIAYAVLCSTKVTQLTTALRTLKEDFIQELLIHEHDSVRVKAFECYGLCSIVDKKTAEIGIHVFSRPIFAYRNGEECDIQTLLICIAAVVDLLRIYGPQLMASPAIEQVQSDSMTEQQEAIFLGGTSLTDIIQGLVDLLNDDQYDIQEQAGRGLCQLVLSNRIISDSLIARLILKWCNPARDNESNSLKQIIGFTLQTLPLIPDCMQLMIDSVFITIETIHGAPHESPLADVSIESIAKFLLALCKVSPDADHIHNKIAERIFKKIIDKPEEKINGLFSKMLLLLDIPNGRTCIDDFLKNCDDVRDIIKEKLIINNIIKFTAKLNSVALDLQHTDTNQEITNRTRITQQTIMEADEDAEELL
ncbi:condensin complex subunit 3-like isoform X1 [Diabrotica virgifera virgifera]|uniref:Nuclear condensin complex subunit 3 C-terminal domain-containing protein n=1 Tax=Diabrotica virgifera virgifera TaxID=50390 RepID=A0ABM5K1D4_DIAVI|nr:condensin complex subunit 3-like isoform X1 [Diabrotica virgifera virgifera]